MPFEAGLNRSWYNRGRKAALKAKPGADMYDAWHAAGRKPTIPGRRVEAQESFYQGWIDVPEKRANPSRRAKSVRLKNFTGTVTRLRGGAVKITGKAKRK